MEVQAGNRTIAEFMGAVWCKDDYEQWGYRHEKHPTETSSRWWSAEALQYHKDWSWLMPVVEKIAQEHSLFRMVLGNCNCVTHFEDATIRKQIGTTPIESTWKSVVQFIQWHQAQSANSK